MPSTKTTKTLDTFTLAYLETALWSSTDETGMHLDRNFDIDDIAPETLAQMIADCEAFQAAHYELIIAEGSCLRCGPDYDEVGHAGHDFWLTRNGHGAGFWDGHWELAAGETLTKAAAAYREVDLYVGDDGLLYA